MTPTLLAAGSIDFSLPFNAPILIFGFAMLLVLLAPLFIRLLRLPSIVGLIAAGALVGPNALGILERDATIVLLGTVGLLYLMFMAGLEIDLNEFGRAKGKSFTFGLVSFAVPQAAGTAVAYYLMDFSLSASALLGSVLASHTLLAYPIASRLRIGKTESSTMTVGGTIVTDTAALMVLAVVVGSQKGELDTEFWITLCGALALYIVGVFVVVPRLGRWFFRRVEEAEAQYIFVLAMLFVCSLLAEVAGVEAIVGAFFAGLALNRLIPESSTLMNRINFVGNALFIPFFLISVGMLVDVRVFFEGINAVIVAGLLTGTVVITKFVAARGVQKIFRFSNDEGWVIFGLSVPQAAATLAATLIGFDIGLFEASTVNGTIVMILVTCVLGPAVVERFGRRVAEAQATTRGSSHGPVQRILVPLVDTSMLESTLSLAMSLRDPHGEEALYPVTVVRDDDSSAGEAVAIAEKVLGEVEHFAAAASVAVVPLTQLANETPIGLTRAIVERRISDVVVGWDARPSEGRIFGRNIDRLLTDSKSELFIAHITGPLNTARRTVVAVLPGTPEGDGFGRAVSSLKKLANQLGALLTVLSLRSERPVVESRFASASPSVSVTHLAVDSLQALLDSMAENMDAADLAAIMGSRAVLLGDDDTIRELPCRLPDLVPGNFFVHVVGESARREIGLDENALKDLLRRLLLQIEAGGDLDDPLLALFEMEFHLDDTLPRMLTAELTTHGRRVDLDGARIYHLKSDTIPYPCDILALSQTPFRLAPDDTDAADDGEQDGSNRDLPVRALGLVLAPPDESRRASERRVAELSAFLELSRDVWASGDTPIEADLVIGEVARAVNQAAQRSRADIAVVGR